MKKLFIVSLLFGLSGSYALMGQPVALSPVKQSGESEWVSGEVIVKLSPGVKMQDLVTRHLLKPYYQSPMGGWWKCRLPDGMDVERAVSILTEDPLVEHVQPNFIFRACWTANDPIYVEYSSCIIPSLSLHRVNWEPNDPIYVEEHQWHLPWINMPGAWGIEQGGDSTVIIGILDTGCAFEDRPIPPYEKDNVDPASTGYKLAPDLVGTHFVQGFDFVNNDPHPNDDAFHGTHMAGIIAQTTNNAYGCAGIAFNVSIMPLKIMDFNGSGNEAGLADAIYYGVAHGADVLNIGVGTDTLGEVAHDAIRYAEQSRGNHCGFSWWFWCRQYCLSGTI